MSILLAQPWPQQSPAEPFSADHYQQPLQLIELTPWTPPPLRIQPSRHFAPNHRRVVRTPSLSTITDRRESMTYASTSVASSAASTSSAASFRASSTRSSLRPPLRPRTSSDSSDSTLSSDSERTFSSDIHLSPAVIVQSSSPDHSLTVLRRSVSLPGLAPLEPTSSATLAIGQDEDYIIADLRRRLNTLKEIPFSPLLPPTKDQLELAADLLIIGQDGKLVRFGSLFESQKTIVCFIRHFWCPLCQDYMYSIMREVDPAALEHAGVRLVIISNGSANMIRSYRQIFRLPESIPLYTDPSRTLYKALGMTLRTLDGGPELEKGEYIRHGHLSGLGMVVKNAIKTRMPITAKGGDVKQLGGEFILGPGLQCTYASRMRTTRAHTSITVLLEQAGVAPPPPPAGLDEWEIARVAALRGICARRMDRRGGLEHLRWVGDCGLYYDADSRTPTLTPTPSDSTGSRSPVREDPLRAVQSEQQLCDTLRGCGSGSGVSGGGGGCGNGERGRTVSDPGPGLVAEWLAGMRTDEPVR